jgi:hypothetical protein
MVVAAPHTFLRVQQPVDVEAATDCACHDWGFDSASTRRCKDVVLLLIQSFRLVQRHQLSMGAVKLGAGGLTSIDGGMMAGSEVFQPKEQRPGYSYDWRDWLVLAVGGSRWL